MSKNNNEICTLNKTAEPKTIHIPLFGKHDCYMEITITEHHRLNCDHLQNKVDTIPVTTPPSIDPKNSIKFEEYAKKYDQPVVESFEEKKPFTDDSKGIINAKTFIPGNKIKELNEILTGIIRSNVKMFDGDPCDLTEYTKCSCLSLECSCVNKTYSPPKEVKEDTENVDKTNSPVTCASETVPNNEIEKLLADIVSSKANVVVRSIGDVTQHTQCSCSSPQCSCINSKTTNASNPPKPISSLTKKPSADSKKRTHVSNSQTQNVTNRDDFINTQYLTDLPLEGHNNQVRQIQEDINEIARDIYNPEEREKKLRLLRLLIQEALPKSNVPIMSKTIEIPHSTDLKKTDSLIIRIIVEN